MLLMCNTKHTKACNADDDAEQSPCTKRGIARKVTVLGVKLVQLDAPNLILIRELLSLDPS